MDGDSRGGAALSIRAVTGKPVKFIGIGREGDGARAVPSGSARRRASSAWATCSRSSRRARAVFDETKTKELASKFRRNASRCKTSSISFARVKKMGSLGDLAKMIPGLGKLVAANRDRRARGRAHRSDHLLDDAARTGRARRSSTRAAAGASPKAAAARCKTSTSLIKQFDASKQMMKQFGRMRRLPGMPDCKFSSALKENRERVSPHPPPPHRPEETAVLPSRRRRRALAARRTIPRDRRSLQSAPRSGRTRRSTRRRSRNGSARALSRPTPSPACSPTRVSTRRAKCESRKARAKRDKKA